MCALPSGNFTLQAYYYVWTSFNMPPRPWAAEKGLLLVIQALQEAGVPIAFAQLDDWW